MLFYGPSTTCLHVGMGVVAFHFVLLLVWFTKDIQIPQYKIAITVQYEELGRTSIPGIYSYKMSGAWPRWARFTMVGVDSLP